MPLSIASVLSSASHAANAGSGAGTGSCAPTRPANNTPPPTRTRHAHNDVYRAMCSRCRRSRHPVSDARAAAAGRPAGKRMPAVASETLALLHGLQWWLMTRVTGTIVATALLLSAACGSVPEPGRGPTRDGRSGRALAPSRDAGAVPASIAGRVVADDTGRPIRHAEITRERRRRHDATDREQRGRPLRPQGSAGWPLSAVLQQGRFRADRSRPAPSLHDGP